MIALVRFIDWLMVLPEPLAKRLRVEQERFERLGKASREELESWAERVLDAESLDEGGR